MKKPIALLFAVVFAAASCAPIHDKPGALPGAPRYEGKVITEWLPDGRDMRLLEDFAFLDASGRTWKASKGSVVNGASIPQALWWSGGPFEGRYRIASVVHDVFCAETPKTATWQAVHRMFYDAMIASGETKARALVMYRAVHGFGPRWPDPREESTGVPPPPPPNVPPAVVEADLREVQRRVDTGELTTPEDIEALPPVPLAGG